MLSVLAAKSRRRRETSGCDGAVCYLECVNGLAGICMYPGSSSCIY